MRKSLMYIKCIQVDSKKWWELAVRECGKEASKDNLVQALKSIKDHWPTIESLKLSDLDNQTPSLSLIWYY